MTFIEQLAETVKTEISGVTVDVQSEMLRVIFEGNVIVVISDDTWLVPKVTISYDIDKQEQIHYGNMHENAVNHIMSIITYSIEYGQYLYPIAEYDRVRWADNLEKVDAALKNFTKEFHLFLDYSDAKWDGDTDCYYYEHDQFNASIYTTLAGTRLEIEKGKQYIATTQVALLSFDLLGHGYRLYVHCNGKILEMKPYMEYKGSKEIRFGHNIAKLLLCHHFDSDFE